MAHAARNPSVDELLAHAGWMRGIARDIVRDPTLAEDIVQDAWLVALERPPSPHSPAGLRAWLLGVVSNLARGRRRRESARGAVERSAARPEATRGDLDALEQLQLQRELTEVLLELREPFRSAVILRHLEGLNSEEIGRRLRCSPQAARQRVTRGLAELRQRLQARGARGGVDRTAALLALAGAAPSASVGATGIGVLLMSKTTWCAVSLAFGLVATWLTWSALHGAPPGEAAGQAELAPATDAVDALATTREAESANSDLVSTDARAAAALPAPALRTMIAVRDTAGAPIEGVSIRARGSATKWGATDALGHFALPDESLTAERKTIAASASHDDFLDADFELQAFETRELTLARKPRVVFDLAAPDGAPLESPWSGSVWVREAAGGQVVQVRADFDGTLCARRLPVGRLERAEARARGFAGGQSAFETALEPDGVLHVRIELRKGLQVAGRIVDAENKQPIAKATVWAEAAFFDANSVAQWTTSDGEGRFELRGLESQLIHDEHGERPIDLVWVCVSAKADGFQGKLLEGKVQQVNAENRYFIELELTRTNCRLKGRLLAGEGLTKPVLVQAVSARGQLTHAFADSEGRFEMEGLEPGVQWLFASNSNWFADPAQAPSDPRVCGRGNVALEAGEEQEVELLLERGSAALGGRVVDARGNSLEGIEVLAQMNERQGMIAWAPFHWSARSDAKGEFRFEALLSGEYSLAFGALPEGWCVLENGPTIQLAAAEQRADERLALSECFSIEGWVELNGHDPAGLRVQARGPQDRGLNIESPVAADASFKLTGLPQLALEVVLLESNRELARVSVGAAGARAVRLVAGP